jgi:DNA-binding phage protein
MKTVGEWEELHDFIDRIFDAAYETMSTNELADAAGLGRETVRRLARYETMFPRFQTVIMLAHAAGFEINHLVRRIKEKRKVG